MPHTHPPPPSGKLKISFGLLPSYEIFFWIRACIVNSFKLIYLSSSIHVRLLPLFQNGIHNFWCFVLKTLFCTKDHFDLLSKESLKENNRLLDFKKILFYYVFISFCPYKRLLMPIYHYIYSYCSFMKDTRELYIEYEEGWKTFIFNFEEFKFLKAWPRISL